MNAQGVELERRSGRPMLARLHAGGALVVGAPGAGVAIVGVAMMGAGLAGVAPTVLGAAPGLSDLPTPVAIAAVTTVGYLGSFTGPPAVGGLAQLTGLSASL